MIIRHLTKIRYHAVPLILLVALALAGCGGGQQEDRAAESQEAIDDVAALTPEQEAIVKKIAAAADAIETAPETMAEVLRDAGLTADEFQSEIYRISADPVLARAYEEARNH